MSKNEITKNSRKKIIEFEKALISNADGVNIEGDGNHILTESKIAPIKHTFADGVYVRQMDLKKDSVVVGAIHKHLHVWFLLIGHITVLANEDSIFVNIHKNPSNTEDIDELEKEIVALNYKEYEQYINKKK